MSRRIMMLAVMHGMLFAGPALFGQASDRAGGGLCPAPGAPSAPNLLSKVNPEYTEQACRAKLQGTVIFSVTVTKDGRVADVNEIGRKLGLGLDEKAVEALRQWRFSPGMKDGQPADTRAVIELTFRILNHTCDRWSKV
jgi:TonB family protein